MLRFLRRLFRKSRPALPAPSSSFALDAYHRHRVPTAHDLLAQLKNTAWSCASINAAVCAAHPPRLFVTTSPGQEPPRLRTRNLPAHEMPFWSAVAPHRFGFGTASQREIESNIQSGVGPPHSKAVEPPHSKSAIRNPQSTIQEVLDHPLLTLLQSVNPVHNHYDLFELTQLYLEVHGAAYWLLDFHPLLKTPSQVWLLPAHLVIPRREQGSRRVVDFYEYRGQHTERFPPERIIHFRFPDPRDPYTAGLSPLRACFEQVALTSEYAAMKRALYDHAGLPSVIVTSDDQIGGAEQERIEKQWQAKFQRGGHGQVLVTDGKVKVTLLAQSLGDLAALADMKATKEDIANAFHVPLPFLSGDTNLANMQAADHLHKTLAILPRLRRRDEKLNEQLIPLFDTSGRLFFATEDPTPRNLDFQLKQEASDVRLGVRTINEVRATRGLTPVAWGDAPLPKA